jgi:hypothetical protein
MNRAPVSDVIESRLLRYNSHRTAGRKSVLRAPRRSSRRDDISDSQVIGGRAIQIFVAPALYKLERLDLLPGQETK